MALKKYNKESLDEILRQGIPGFGDAFVNRVIDQLGKIRPLQETGKQPVIKTDDLSKELFSGLVRIMKERPRKPNPHFSAKVVDIKNWLEIRETLLKKRLATQSKDQGEHIKITALGRRFVASFEKAHTDKPEK